MLQDRLQEIIRQAQAGLTELPTAQSVTQVRTAEQLRIAMSNGGFIDAKAGVYGGNFVATKPTFLFGIGVDIQPEDRYLPTFTVLSNDVTVKGPVIGNGATDRECVVVGEHKQTDANKQPHRVIFEHVTLQAKPEGGKRGFSLHGSDISILNSKVLGFWYQGSDAQGVWINNGRGPYTIENNIIEGSGENLMVGGDRLYIGETPSNILIRWNTFRKPQEWRTKKGSVKNLLELKAGKGVWIDNNTFDGCWGDAQIGTPIVFTPRNQYGDNPYVCVDDVTFSHNLIKNCPDAYAINILGSDNINTSAPSTHMNISRNLFLDTPRGLLIGNAGELELDVHNNSFLGIRHTYLLFTGATCLKHLAYTQNIAKEGSYGIHADGGPGNVGNLSYACKTYLVEHNLFELGERPIRYTTPNRSVLSGALMPMLGTDYKLPDGSAGW